MNEPILSVIGLLAVVLLVLAGAYAFTRWAGRSLGGGLMAGLGGGRRLQVLDGRVWARTRPCWLSGPDSGICCWAAPPRE